jgi:type I restriction enzyme S subunit
LQPKGTILLSFKLSFGRVGIAGLPLYTNEAIAGLRSKRICHEYLYQGLQQWDLLQGVDQAIKGATLNKEKLRRIEFNFPESHCEQFKIAEVLSTVERAIEQTEVLIAKQKRLKDGLVTDLLTRGIDPTGALRSEETHEFKDSPIGRIPAEWSCEVLSRFVPSAEYGISTSLSDDGVPVLRMNNLFEGRVDLSELKYTARPVPESLWLRPGDVLFNRTNSWEHVGRTGIWKGECAEATFASYLVRLNSDRRLLSSELLNIWLNWPRTQIAMRRLATPAVQQVNINPTNLRQLLAAFPGDLDEQIGIVDLIDKQVEAVERTRAAAKKLKSIKTGLMQDLLTGKKRVLALLKMGQGIAEVA